MAFSIDTYEIPRLGDWIRALSHWEVTEPWRGEHPDAPRPLNKSRSRKGQTIRRA